MKITGRYLIYCVILLLPSTFVAGQQSMQHQMHSGNQQMTTPLTESGNAIFATVQEAIRALEADPNTDWSQVDMEALRQHLIDMRNVALFVDVLEHKDIENGLQFQVAATSDEAGVSLERVLEAHPQQLAQETGWEMKVTKQAQSYLVRVTTGNPDEVHKIRGLGYIGLIAYGNHHQRHHWMILHEGNPHQ